MKILATAAASLACLASPLAAEEAPYEVNGERFVGWFEAAETPRGLVMIVHDWDGLTEYEKRRAGMLAEMGYDAFAIDMFGEETPVETVEHRRAATGALYRDRTRMRGLLKAGLAEARERSGADRTVVMGYCFGGAATLEMARSDMAGEAEGYATFHGGLSTPEGQGWNGDEPPLLIMHGGADGSITLDDVAAFAKELEAAGNVYSVEIYSNAPHAFTVFGSERYQERADAESWAAFARLLEDRFSE